MLDPEEKHEALAAVDECVDALASAHKAIADDKLEDAHAKLRGVGRCIHEIQNVLSCTMAGEETIAKWRELAEQGRQERQKGQKR